MALALSSTIANSILNALCRNTAWSQPTAFWLKLHTAAPGASGATSPATETTRRQVNFGNAASSGSIVSTADVTWTNVAAAETYTHVSAWSASSGGTFLASGSINSTAVGAGDTFIIPSGTLTLTLDVAS